MTTEFHCPKSFELTKHDTPRGRLERASYWLKMNYKNDGCPLVLLGVHVSPEALALFAAGNVKGAHVETLVQASVAKKALGYANYVVMGVETMDGTLVPLIPGKLRSAFWGRVGLGLALTIAGIALLGLVNNFYAVSMLLAGTHVFRTGMDVPHTPFWGHFPHVPGTVER